MEIVIPGISYFGLLALSGKAWAASCTRTCDVELRSLLPVISLVVVLSATLTIVAAYLPPSQPRLFYVLKPLTTILILITALVPGTSFLDPYAGIICLGLIFSLIGDIWLMLPGDRFRSGLASFLLAHLCYVFAFRSGLVANAFPWLLLMLSIFGLTVLRYIWPALPEGLKAAVSLYISVIILMTALAAARATIRPAPDILSAAVGALLFLTSDLVLAVDRFRKPFHLAHAVVLASYFAGQLLIALSVGLRVNGSA